MVVFTYDKTNQLIIIPISYGTELDVQDLLNDIRDFEDNWNGIDIYHIAEASGKQDLGGGVLVGITLTLIDWKVQFAARPGPDYVLCSITGGNLVTYDTDTTSYITPVEPSAFVTVTLTASSSATLSELSTIQYASFNEGVTIDTANGTAGTTFPAGTIEQPVDNLADAKSIAISRGFSKFYILGDIVLAGSDDIDSYTLIGESPHKSTIYIRNGCSTLESEFENALISGTLGGECDFESCNFDNIYGIDNGHMHDCMLTKTIYLTGNSQTDLIGCYSGVPGLDTPNIDFQHTQSSLGMRDYTGGINLLNISHTGSNVSMDFLSGHGKVDSTCTSGTVVIRGTAKVTNNCTSGCTVDITNVVNPYSVADQSWNELISGTTDSHMTDGSSGYLLSGAFSGGGSATLVGGAGM